VLLRWAVAVEALAFAGPDEYLVRVSRRQRGRLTSSPGGPRRQPVRLAKKVFEKGKNGVLTLADIG
jgi:hypothetical protein